MNIGRFRGPARWKETHQQWSLLSIYEKFEQIIALVLSLIIAIVIVFSIFQLIMHILPLLIGGALDPLDHKVFQSLFGMIMTVLIAMEFKHSIIRVVLRHESIIQVKTVILIALLAISRKFIILDTQVTGPATIAALAVSILVLGIVYWLMRERDDRLEPVVQMPPDRADHRSETVARRHEAV